MKDGRFILENGGKQGHTVRVKAIFCFPVESSRHCHRRLSVFLQTLAAKETFCLAL